MGLISRGSSGTRRISSLYELVRSNKPVFDKHEADGDWFGSYGPARLITTSDTASQLLIMIRKDLRRPERKVIHVVNWAEPSPFVIRLRRNEFPAPPNRLIIPDAPEGKSISPLVQDGYYVYRIGASLWSVLLTDE